MQKVIDRFVLKEISIAPLITFRILFGLLMCFGAVRFCMNGWVDRLYIAPKFFFKFYAFEWVSHLGETGTYALFAMIIISSLGIALGVFYRFFATLFFLSFTYVQLIDATNYLNHYYLVCLLALMLVFLPANSDYSIDTWLKITPKKSKVPAWCINLIIFQLIMVYFLAGIAKLEPDWIFRAMPLAIWLPEHQNLPVIGEFLGEKWVAYAFSWAGALYDLTIAFFLIWKRTRWFAYIAVLVFHITTSLLFNIGLFPLIMITSTLIFFSAQFHESLLSRTGWRPNQQAFQYSKIVRTIGSKILIFFIIIQILIPFRHFLYPGNLLWTEEGYRFSWRVMLVEKSGLATFHIKDSQSDRKQEIVNRSFLTSYQEKQMSIQPDFILQFAHHLKNEYITKHGFVDPIVTVDAHVALNGRSSQRLIEPQVNLSEITDNFLTKKWILPFQE